MTNPDLARDYFTRARKRLKAVALLLDEEAFADVVRESQEVVELLLKAALRHFGIAVPFSHEPSQSFMENAERLPEQVRISIPRWSEISRKLRRDRELAPRRERGRERDDGSAGEGPAVERAHSHSSMRLTGKSSRPRCP